MAFVVKLTGVSRFLEIGVFTGYNLDFMVLALPEGGIIAACYINNEYIFSIMTIISRSCCEAKVRIFLS